MTAAQRRRPPTSRDVSLHHFTVKKVFHYVFSAGTAVAPSVALPLRHHVLQPLQQHVRAAAAAVLGTRPLARGVARRRHQHVPLHGEGPLAAHAALPDHAVDVG